MTEKKYANGTSTTFMPAETTGAMKRDNIFHWSIDELIDYKASGVRPKLVIDEKYIFELAKCGVSIKNICGLFNITEPTFCANPTFLSAHAEGRSQIATRNRALIAEQALNGNLQAQIYLDKLMGGDVDTQQINLNVTTRPLETIPTENLIDVVFKDESK